MNGHSVAALVIFILTYASLTSRRLRLLPLERPAAALTGAVLMILLGGLSLEQAFAAISFDTLTLLLGMMILVEYLRDAAFFEWVAQWMVRRAKTPKRLLTLTMTVSALLSALFVNDTICLMLTPVVLATTIRANLPPIPYLLALAIGSNLGSAATLVGNPQNMLVGISSGMAFWRYTLLAAPAVLGGTLLGILVMQMIYRRELPKAFSLKTQVAPADVDRPLLAKGLLVTLGVLIGFSVTGELATTALAGGASLILLDSHRSSKILAKIDWTLILFFAGLFVVVGGVNRIGLLDGFGQGLASLWGDNLPAQIVYFSGATLLLSNLFSNVPFVMIAQHWIAGFATPELMWVILAVMSTFAGNLLLLGSVANLIVVEGARHHVHIGFRAYLKAGVPVTLVSSLWAVGVLLLY